MSDEAFRMAQAVHRLCDRLDRLLLVMELQVMEQPGYETGGVSRDRWERAAEIRRELGWKP